MYNIIRAGNYYIEKSKISGKDYNKLVHEFTYHNPKTDLYKIAVEIRGNLISFPRNKDKLIKVFGKNIKVTDKTVMPPMDNAIVLSKEFKLFEHQEIAVKEVIKTIKNKDNAILKALPGFGKSYILPFIVNKLNTKTLIIVDRTDLVTQMYKEFMNNCDNINISIINAQNKKPADVTIVTFQFLIRNLEFMKKYHEYFGLVVVDEAHIIGSNVFTKVVGNFSAHYRLGLSATPTRSDGMTALLYDVMGMNIVNGVSTDNLVCTIIKVKMNWAMRSIKTNYKKDYAKFITGNNVPKDVLIIIPSIFHTTNTQILFPKKLQFL